jgi:hypothetical protein
LRPLPAILFAVAAVGVLASYLVKDIGALAQSGDVAKFLGSTTMLGVFLVTIGFVLYAFRAQARDPGQPST